MTPITARRPALPTLALAALALVLLAPAPAEASRLLCRVSNGHGGHGSHGSLHHHHGGGHRGHVAHRARGSRPYFADRHGLHTRFGHRPVSRAYVSYGGRRACAPKALPHHGLHSRTGGHHARAVPRSPGVGIAAYHRQGVRRGYGYGFPRRHGISRHHGVRFHGLSRRVHRGHYGRWRCR